MDKGNWNSEVLTKLDRESSDLFYNTCCLLEARLEINKEWVLKKHNWLPKNKMKPNKSTVDIWQNGKSRPELVIENFFVFQICKRQSFWKIIFYKTIFDNENVTLGFWLV